MKNSICLFLIFIQFMYAKSQTPLWTWVTGDKIINQNAIYGNKGEFNASNKPGSRYGSLSWRGNDGQIWLFGGYGLDDINPCVPYSCNQGYQNDLWRYDPTLGLWNWIAGDKTLDNVSVYGAKGITAAENKPGGLTNASTWVGKDGKLWIFGGAGVDANSNRGFLNDMWSYDPQTGYWTWEMGGKYENQKGNYGTKGEPSQQNIPGSRMFASSWVGLDGSFWLMGGFGYGETAAGDLNDLWNFNPDTKLWTWVSGDKEVNQVAVFGNKGEGAPANNPAGTEEAMSWTGIDGQLWLMGGRGTLKKVELIDASGNTIIVSKYGRYNDLWSFNPETGYWIWHNGTQEIDQYGQYGTKGIPSSTNLPGGRTRSVTWRGNDGKLWMFGGFGYTDASLIDNNGLLNELWSYDPQSGNWTWEGGEKTVNQYGVYGSLKVPSTTTYPGSRELTVTWTGLDGRFWMFGGNGFDELGYISLLNDLWFFDMNNPVNAIVNSAASNINDSISNYNFSNEKIKSEKKFKSDVTLFPNPGKGDYQLALKGFEKGSLRIRILDIHGRVVYSKAIMMNSESLIIPIDLNKMSSGIYYAQIQQSLSSQFLKIIKE